MRLIDADTAIRKLQDKGEEPMYQHTDEDWKCGLFMAEDIINDLPTIDLVKNRLQKAIASKTAEETYDFLSWLMFDYAKQYTDSRSAVIKWIKDSEENET